MNKRNILDLNLKELEAVLSGWKQGSFHARQIFSWIYKKQVLNFDAMSDQSTELRSKLKENFCLGSLKLIKGLKSTDGTQKLLFELSDLNLVEAVIIPAESRVTGCISTQVGCKFACSFCASGAAGFKRNLSCGEIIEQVLELKKNAPDNQLTHLVYMGTGEPFDNYENVLKSIRIINSPDGLNIGARRITISTSGVIPGIKKLADEQLQVELSISLHSADEKTRSGLMPINKKYSLKDLISACRDYIKKTDRQITFEYILISGVNSDLQNAQKLSTMLRSLRLAKVNLIPANAVKELRIAPPKKLEILFFKDYLLKQGLNVTLRKERGQDIEAACGQLRLRYADK